MAKLKRPKYSIDMFEKIYLGSEQQAEFPLDLVYPPNELCYKNYVFTFNREGMIMQECYKDYHQVATFIPREQIRERAVDLLVFANSLSCFEIAELKDDRRILVEKDDKFNLVIFG